MLLVASYCQKTWQTLSSCMFSIVLIVRFDRHQPPPQRTCSLRRPTCHFNAPLRQDDDDLQRRQTRSPGHALGNEDRQIRHFLIFPSTVRSSSWLCSSSCAACRRVASVSLSKASPSSEEPTQELRAPQRRAHVIKLTCAIDSGLAAFGGNCAVYLNVLRRIVSATRSGSADAKLQHL